MKFLTPLYNSGVGFFWGLEATHENALSVDLNSGVVTPVFMNMDAFEPGAVVRSPPCVLGVLLSCCGTQITPTVVGSVIVAMVYFMRRPLVGHVKPREVVLGVISTINVD